MNRADLNKNTADIASMFDQVADRYDLMNGVMSMGQHLYWRAQTVKAVEAAPGQRILDIAAGTGTSSEPFADLGADVVAADLSEGMLEVGRKRRPDITFVQADVTDLQFEDEEFDAVTMSYGLRNVADYPRALRELYRVTKPGGRIVINEFSTPTFAPFRAVYKNYIMKAIPLLPVPFPPTPNLTSIWQNQLLIGPIKTPWPRLLSRRAGGMFSTVTSPAESWPSTAVSSPESNPS